MSSGLTMNWARSTSFWTSLSAALRRFSSMAIRCSRSSDAGLELVGPPRAGDLGVAELALEGREEVHRVAPAVGPGDLAFLLAEKDRELGDEVGVDPPPFADELLGADEDQVGEIDVAQPGAKGQDVVAPVFGIERVGGHRGQALGVAQPVAGEGLELEDEQAGSEGASALNLASRSRIRRA